MLKTFGIRVNADPSGLFAAAASKSSSSSLFSSHRPQNQIPKSQVSFRTAKNVAGVSMSTAGGESLTYKGAGVDIDAGTELVNRIKKMAPGIGGFGGLFPFGTLFCSFLSCVKESVLIGKFCFSG